MEFLVGASTKDGYTIVEQDMEPAIDMACRQLESEGVKVERRSDETSGQIHLSGLDISEFAGYLPTLINDIPPIWMKENRLVRRRFVRNLEEKRVNILRGLVENGIDIKQEEGVVDYLKKMTTAKRERCADTAAKTLDKIGESML
ncbi:MAG: hypothetical protein JSU70_02140 [Phycisphaerales bacterium]|nr:MAG: hypothetical protein JSU70_02140 [Phycisphaerales bacterium]